MAIIRDRSLLDGDMSNVPIPLLMSCLKEHRLGGTRLDSLERYYLGLHPILARKPGGDPSLPNNRLVANHAKYITDIAVGYVSGNPVKYQGAKIEDLLDVYKRIDIVSHDTELAKDLSIFGVGLELYFMTSDANPIPRATAIDPRQIFLVVDDTVEYKSLFGVHYYPKRDVSNSQVGWNITVYTATTITRYFAKELENPNYEQLGEQQRHYFAAVPIVEFWNNEECQGDFEQQISLIDAYNVLQSDRVNDKEQLVDAILKVKGISFGDDVPEAARTIKLLKELKVLEMPGENCDAEWLTKNLNETEVEVLRKAIRDDIHQFAGVPMLTDENFASQASGVAMKYKLLGLEQLAKMKERYFTQGLRERMQVFANMLAVKGKNVDVSDVTITMTRNLPSNDLETSQMIAVLSGKVSNDTLISQLSFVQDAKKETLAANAEKEADLKRSQKAFGMPMESL